MHARAIISTNPEVKGSTNDALIRCIEDGFDCVQVCTSCADACLGEERGSELRQCFRLNMDCADVCMATATIATRCTGSNEQSIQQMLQVCAMACRICGEECAKYAQMHWHCKVCAEACRSCEDACRAAGGTIH